MMQMRMMLMMMMMLPRGLGRSVPSFSLLVLSLGQCCKNLPPVVLSHNVSLFNFLFVFLIQSFLFFQGFIFIFHVGILAASIIYYCPILLWSIFHFGYHFNQRGLITVLVKKMILLMKIVLMLMKRMMMTDTGIVKCNRNQFLWSSGPRELWQNTW